MKVPIKKSPQDIKDKYNLLSLVTSNGFVYIKIKKGMYGLKKAAMLVYKNLIKKLKKDGYTPIPHTDNYLKHEKYSTIFCLCVDDFGVKHFEYMASDMILHVDSNAAYLVQDGARS